MRKIFILFSCCISGLPVIAQSEKLPITIIPEPSAMVRNTGICILPKTISIQVPDLPELSTTTSFLTQRLSMATGYTATHSTHYVSPTITLSINKVSDPKIGTEGYRLTTTAHSITIEANKPAGLFYGVQTLIQLFPKEIESKIAVPAIKWQIPCVTITDQPRFGWRGLMFDVSRHFFTKSEVKDFIDQMARYKFNLFHWHLTDDEGWRIEIDRKSVV